MILRKCVAYSMRCMSLIIAVAIFVLSAQAKLPIPVSVSFPYFDKLLHAIAFGSFAFAFSYWFSNEKFTVRPVQYFLIVCAVTAAYGVTDEVHQIFVPGRDASVYDWFADCTGAALATGLRLGVVRAVRVDR